MGKPLTAWSYSRLSTYEKCPKQAEYKYIEKLPEPESPALENGKRVHETIAQYLRGDLPANDPIPGWTYFASLFRQLRDLEPLVEQEWGFTRTWDATGWFGRDTWFRSVLDAGLIYEDGTADVIDFKTGKPYEQDTAKQAELYAISVARRYPQVRTITVRFWYVDLAQEGKEAVYRFNADMVPALLAKWTERAERMLTDKIFAPKPGQHCKWCAFAKSAGGPCKYG